MTRLPRIGLAAMLLMAAVAAVPDEAGATVPGDIGRIVFVSDADDSAGEIYVRDFFGNSPIRLTNNTVADTFPRWSPDGEVIAFMRGSNDVWTMGPDGSDQTNLTSSPSAIDRPLSWSPDSLLILFASDRGGAWDLWTMRPDGSDLTQLTNTPEVEFAADWSPDGSTIVYSRNSVDPGLWLMDANGGNRRRLIPATSAPIDYPTWSPDGSKVAYFQETASGSDIWVVDADGSHPTNLTNYGSYSNWSPAWSPDGSKIAFTSNRDGDTDLWIMNPDGSGAGHLTDNPASEYQMSWESANQDPIAVDDEVHVSRGYSIEIAVLANDSDPDGDEITVTDVTRMPAEGSVTINATGTITYTHDGTEPPPGHVLVYTDSFDYEIQDTRLGSAIGTVVVWLEPGFDDVPESNIFHDEIIWLASQRITMGCNPPDNTLFCPGDPLTRGQMAAFLVRALELTDDGGGDLFVDDNGSVFEHDIDKLGTAGVTRGCNPPLNNRFCPNDAVTRGQMAAFLVRAYSLSSGASSDLFVDDDGSVFEDDIDKLGATGVSRGCNPPVNDRFCPDELVTREQMAAFLYRAVATML